MNKFKLLFALLLLVGFIACGDDDEDPMVDPMEETCETDNLTYTNGIADIVNGSCAVAGCHVAGTAAPFAMSNYDETFAAVGFGRILGTINHEEGFSPMPPSGVKLDDCTIEKLTVWINAGAPE